MNRCHSLIATTALILLFTHATLAGSATASELDPAARQSMEQVIEQYIRAHPEVIEQSSRPWKRNARRRRRRSRRWRWQPTRPIAQ